MPDESYYTPARINTILRNWPRYQSQSEGCRSTPPDAFHPSKGRRGDQLAGADIRADIERAIVGTVTVGSLEWRVVTFVMAGRSLTAFAHGQQQGKGRTMDVYDMTCQRMATFLGWIANDAPT